MAVPAAAAMSTLMMSLGAGTVTAQAPGAGWVMKPSPEGSVQELYFALQKQTEIWVHVEPRRQDGTAAPFYLLFSVIFDGKRLPDSVESILVQAAPAPNMIVDHVTLSLVLDGAPLALDAPPYSPQMMYPGCFDPSGSCGSATGIQVEVPVATIRRIAAAGRVSGNILGVPVTLTASHLAAIGRFLDRAAPEHRQ